MLEGDYKDRQLAWFSSMDEIKASKNELSRIVNEIIFAIDKSQAKHK